jgi:hypothetical protein
MQKDPYIRRNKAERHMNGIDFNESAFLKADQKDLMSFFSMAAKDERFKGACRLWAGSIAEIADEKNPLMATIQIRFQMAKGKSREQRHFIWESYRAKSHACSNSKIFEIL